MIKVFKYLLLFVLFLEALIVFAPKERLVNLLLSELDKKSVNIKSYIFKDNLFLINLQDSEIVYDKIDIAKVGNINITSYLFFNTIKINTVSIDESLKNFLPPQIKNIFITYSILNPLYIDIEVYSALYKVTGFVDILNQKVVLNLNISKQFKLKYPKLIKEFKYDKSTKEYTYEYSL